MRLTRECARERTQTTSRKAGRETEMYAWQRRSKKPLAPQKPTDFDDVLKLTDGAKKLVLIQEEEEEKENALPSSKNASFEEKDVTEGEEKESDEEDDCESWERMRTKAMEASVKLEFKRAARWFGKSLEKLQIEEKGARRSIVVRKHQAIGRQLGRSKVELLNKLRDQAAKRSVQDILASRQTTVERPRKTKRSFRRSITETNLDVATPDKRKNNLMEKYASV